MPCLYIISPLILEYGIRLLVYVWQFLHQGDYLKNYTPVKQIFLKLYFNPDQLKSTSNKVLKAFTFYLFCPRS